MKNIKIAVVGLGYVGLPLARLFSTKYETIGLDLNKSRVEELNNGHDSTMEVDDELLQDAINNHGFRCTTNIDELKEIIDMVSEDSQIDLSHKLNEKGYIKCKEGE